MRFCVVGAGAIGGFLGAMLSKSGEEVTLIARGPHLEAMKKDGIRLVGASGELEARPAVTSDPADVGPVDVVLLTLKAHSIPSMAERLQPLLAPHTSVVCVQNGVPWWYFFGLAGPLGDIHLEAVDPGRIVSRSIGPDRAIGCVTYCSAVVGEPGIIEHIDGTRFPIGEPDHSRSERCHQIAKALTTAGLRCPIRRDIRRDVWVKLMGNLAYNPISVLSRATLLQIVQCPETRDLAADIMKEAESVARSLGIETGISVEQRLAGAEKVGHHKTSMLQDFEAGRPMELAAIAGAVVELGEKVGCPMPFTRAVFACAKLLQQTG